MLKQKKNLNINIKKKLPGKYLHLKSNISKKKCLYKKFYLKYCNGIFGQRSNVGLQNSLSINYLKYLYFCKVSNFFSLILYTITFRAYSNNIFCTLKKKDANKSTFLFSRSAGLYLLNVSKKNAKYNHYLIIKKFFNNLNKFIKKKNKKVPFYIYIKLTVPFQLIEKITTLTFINYGKYAKFIIINTLEKKIYNGCRPKKKRRKKRQGLRIFK